MTKFKTIRVENQDNSAQIVLQHPPSNIIDFEMMSELSAALDAVKDSSLLKLTSSLPNFSTGVDIQTHTPDHMEQMLHDFHAVCRQLYFFEGITIAMLNGFALGGGMELALVCDFICAAGDTKLGFPEVTLACFPPVAVVLLPHLIGRRAYRLLYSGQILSSTQAKELGLIDDNIDLERLKTYSPNALNTLKKVLKANAGFDFDQDLRLAEQLYVSRLKNHPDTKEGIDAFLEKRKPKW